MTDLRKAAEMALDALEKQHNWMVANDGMFQIPSRKAINALRQALAQPEREQFKCTVVDDDHPNGVPLSQWGKQPTLEQTVSMTEYKRLQDLVTSQGIRLMEYESEHEPEPVAWIRKNGFRFNENLEPKDDSEIPLYTAPPQPKTEQKPVATVVGRQYEDGTYAGNALDWAGRNCEDDFPVGTKLYTSPQPEQEPFCYHDGRNIVGKEYADHSDVFPLYTAPPKREWVGLTDEDKQEAFDETQEASGGFWEFADYLEAKLKEKNND